MLQDFFQAFAIKSLQLRQAINQSEDGLVQSFDRELQAIVDDILAYKASSRDELHRQFEFLCMLVRQEADDRLAVVRRIVTMSGLIDRYFRDHSDPYDVDFSPAIARPAKAIAPAYYEQPLFNEAILDSLDDNIIVVTHDYRYLYTNHAYAKSKNRARLSLIGCHVTEFIGEDGFYLQAKPALDRCFAGEKVGYIHHTHRDGQRFATRCRMTPLRASTNHVMGAVVVLSDIEEMATLECG
ncbi:PAS domain S-box-containing protein [Agrobacterium larrymoorei]|uniref:PAS domain S-box-containing protein n=3 Tax=Rhizobium/Agrobacterium group TaxID=227290 RepID=A0ABU0ULV2_9HYPH|nr:PAS domain S-box-containing protein [Agrobacterium larrymoorei]